MIRARRGVAVPTRAAPPAEGNSDQSSAAAPVTNGTATLVPIRAQGEPTAARLVTASPGARSPRVPIERPRSVRPVGRPSSLQAATGMTHGWAVSADALRVPWLPAAATTGAL